MLKRKCYYSTIIFGWLITQIAFAAETITPSHVYQKVENIILEIDILRETIGVEGIPTEPEPQSDKTPIHVYSKGLEVLEKVARVQRKLGMVPVEVGEIPLKQIKPADVFQLVEVILTELRSIKKQLLITEKSEPTELVGGKTPSQVYEELWVASYMLDGLIEPIQPNEVYRNIQYLDDELRLIAAKLNATLDLDPPKIKGRKRLKNIGQQALLALYKISSLERRLGMEAASIPDMTLARITSSDIYDITNVLMAELVHIKVHLKIELPRGDRPMPPRKRPNEVFAQMQLVVNNLDKLIQAVAAQNKATSKE
jgi:hypothetical protein